MSPFKLRTNLVFYFSILFFLQIEISSTSEKCFESDCYQKGGIIFDGVCTVIDKGNKFVSFDETKKLCEKLIPGGRLLILKDQRSKTEILSRLANAGCESKSCAFWIGLQQTAPGVWKWVDGTDVQARFSTSTDHKCYFVYEFTPASDTSRGYSCHCDRKISITHTICQARVDPDPPSNVIFYGTPIAVAVLVLSFVYMGRHRIYDGLRFLFEGKTKSIKVKRGSRRNGGKSSQSSTVSSKKSKWSK